jgi:hypothetical protein
LRRKQVALLDIVFSSRLGSVRAVIMITGGEPWRMPRSRLRDALVLIDRDHLQ